MIPTPIASERVSNSDACLDIMHCYAFAPYYRVSDPQVGVVLWLISDQGHACIVNDRDFVLAVPGQQWQCSSGWRFRRGS